MKNQKIFLLVHEFYSGKTIESYSSEEKARQGYKDILTEYKDTGYNIDVNAKNDSELIEATNMRLNFGYFENGAKIRCDLLKN